ncbi:hypothetical protein F5882DRAFT_404076 [Hyaloscypha sp. PMI_1271]|nr:hypothetical protein F5882DRAFT_404076 [Hyaloscypha sp. PMI_1271]
MQSIVFLTLSALSLLIYKTNTLAILCSASTRNGDHRERVTWRPSTSTTPSTSPSTSPPTLPRTTPSTSTSQILKPWLADGLEEV